VGALKLYLDEDVSPGLARVLRSRGYDVVSAYEVEMTGKTDEEQLSFAVSQERALLTFNVRHYAPLVDEYYEQGKEHSGVIVSRQMGLSGLVRLTLSLLSQVTAEEMRNRLDWLQAYRR